MFIQWQYVFMTKELIKLLIIIGIILTPLFGIIELLEVFPVFAGIRSSGAVIFIKPIKDILMAAILLLFFADVLSGRKFLNNMCLHSLLMIIGLAFFMTSLYISPLLAFIGLRVFSPILLIYVAHKYVDMEFLKNILKILVIVAAFEFIAALLQMFYGSQIHGVNYLGLAARPFGTFVNPWSFAVFIFTVVALMLGYDVYAYGIAKPFTWLFVLISVFFAAMTGSGGGLMGFLIVLLCYFVFYSKVNIRLKISIFPVFFLLPILFFMNMALLTGRDRIYESVGARIGILSNYLSGLSFNELLLGQGLGIGSNAALSFSRVNPFGINNESMLLNSDSLYVSIFSQLGAIFMAIFVVFNLLLFVRALKNKYYGSFPAALLLIPALLAAGFANSIIELFPVNWVLFIIYGMILKHKKRGTGYNDYEKHNCLGVRLRHVGSYGG